MTDSERIAALRGLPSFSDYGEEDLRYLLPYVERESFRSGQSIIKTGSTGDKVYYLVSGRVKVLKDLSLDLSYLGYKPVEIVETLGSFGPGYHFGEMGLLGNHRRSADVVAEEDCELFSVSKGSFDRILGENKEIGQRMLLTFCTMLASWMRAYDEKLKENIQNRTLVEMLKAEKKKMAALHKITRSVVFSTMGQVLDTILEACMDCLNVEKGSLMIFADGYLRVDAAFGPDRFAISGRQQEIRESSVAGRCFISGQPLLVEDIGVVEGLTGAGDGSQYFNGSLLSVPLISLRGETIGVLNVNNKTSRELFTEEDRTVLQGLAQEAAASLSYEIEHSRKNAVAFPPQSLPESRALPGDLASLTEFNTSQGYFRIRYEDVVRSTNDMAGDLIRQGYSHGTVVVANEQSHGKGGLGRPWFSPSGQNIYMTIVVAPRLQDVADKIPLINLVTSLSVAVAIRSRTGLEAWPKWPNNVCFGNRQIGGILSESLMTGSALQGLLTGIGINVNQESFPEGLRDGSTSIFIETGRKTDRGALIIEVLKTFHEHYNLFLENPGAIVTRWTQLSRTIGRKVRVRTPTGEFVGRAAGINESGMLLVELPGNKVLPLASGEIFDLTSD